MRFEYYGIEDDMAAKARCDKRQCTFTAYNQAASDAEFETARDICRPKPECREKCAPTS